MTEITLQLARAMGMSEAELVHVRRGAQELGHMMLETPGIAANVQPTELHKCGRCWRYLPEVEEDGDLCDRCDEVVDG